MTNQSEPLRISILAHPWCSIPMAALFRDVLIRSNQVAEAERFEVQMVSARRGASITVGDVTIKTHRVGKEHVDVLMSPPSPSFGRELPDWEPERRLIRRLRERGTRLASSCLGALLLADAGVLDGRTATTHWGMNPFAYDRYPLVNWQLDRLICDEGDVITAGGYFATIDLALTFVEQIHGRTTAHTLGSLLLADSTRQKQSLYATHLIREPELSAELSRVQAWIGAHLDQSIGVADLASEAGVAPRTLIRMFHRELGLTPIRYVQLRRIERAKELLAAPNLSVDAVLEHIGVSDLSTFRTLFQREIGMTPAEFRRRLLLSS